MPKIAMDYSKSIIYKIVCKDTSITECYVGSTTNLTKRRWQHKFSCNNETIRSYNYYVYKFIRENGGWYNWDMVMVEEFACDNKMKLFKQERYWVETLKATLNSVKPINFENEVKQYREQYRKDNKEKQKQIDKQYRKDNEKKIKEKDKQYRKDNKEIINKKASEELGCRICKCIVSRRNFSRHKKSKRHINNL